MYLTKTSIENALIPDINDKIYDVLCEYLSERLSSDIMQKMEDELEALTDAFLIKYAMDGEDLGID